ARIARWIVSGPIPSICYSCRAKSVVPTFPVQPRGRMGNEFAVVLRPLLALLVLLESLNNLGLLLSGRVYLPPRSLCFLLPDLARVSLPKRIEPGVGQKSGSC